MADSPTSETSSPPAAAGFVNGDYLIRGEAISSGIFKGGKFEGKPFLRFVYRIENDGPAKGMRVALTLPWVPDWAPCQISFKINMGMPIREFDEACREEQITTRDARRAFSLRHFQGVMFEAEVRQRIDAKGNTWYDVWQLKSRRGRSTQAPGPTGAPKDPVAAEIIKLARELGLSKADLAAMCEEEFAVSTYAELPQDMRPMFRDLLAQRKIVAARQAEADLPM